MELFKNNFCKSRKKNPTTNTEEYISFNFLFLFCSFLWVLIWLISGVSERRMIILFTLINNELNIKTS